MRAVVQRVSAAKVCVGEQQIAQIGKGLVVLLGVAVGDTEQEARWIARKIAGLRVFEDASGKMNLAAQDVAGAVLLVSNFTVCADVSTGKRPSFDLAAPFEIGRTLYQVVAQHLRSEGIDVRTGAFGESMALDLTNDGPVTIVIDTPSKVRP